MTMKQPPMPSLTGDDLKAFEKERARIDGLREKLGTEPILTSRAAATNQ